MARGNLVGVRVCLSASLADDMRPAPRTDTAEFIAQLARAVFREGGHVVHGSHPSIVPLLAAVAKETFPDGGATSRLTLVRAATFSGEQYAGAIEADRAFARVELIPAATPAEEDAARAEIRDLVPMRDWMADRCDVVVALGGRWFDRDAERAGIPIEIDAFLERGKPAFVITACGGAAAGYAEADPGLSGRLHNGLDATANRALDSELADESCQPAAAAGVAEKIVKQIGLLPLPSRRIQVRSTAAAPPRSRSVRAAISGTAPEPPPRDTFRILCLDGGGIRGAFTAAVLATWADMLPKTAGQPLFVDRFDLVAGTSTGSILAVGLALGLTPGELVELYREHAEKIFPRKSGLSIVFSRKYDSAPLRAALETYLGDKVFTEAKRPLVIPTVSAVHGEAVLITTPHSPDRTAHRDMKAVEAILASAAAPAFFADANVDGPIASGTYIDGGMWANNPVLPAIIEAIGYLGTTADRIDILSLGTMATEYDFSKALGGGLAQWGPRISDLFFAAQETGAAEMARTFLGDARLLRINDFTKNLPTLDDAQAVSALVERGQQIGRKTFPSVRSRFLEGPPAPASAMH